MNSSEFRSMILSSIRNRAYERNSYTYSKANSMQNQIYDESGSAYETVDSLLCDASSDYVKAVFLYEVYRKWSGFSKGEDVLRCCYNKIGNINSVASRLRLESEEDVDKLLYILNVKAKEKWEEIKRTLDKENGDYFQQREFEKALSDAKERSMSRTWGYLDYF